MKTFYERKFKFEDRKEWINSFAAMAGSMLLVFIFALGFYQFRMKRLYESTSVKQSKAILETVGFTIKYLKKPGVSYEYNSPDGKKIKTGPDGEVPGLSNSIQGLMEALKESDPNITQLLYYNGNQLVSGIAPGGNVSNLQNYTTHYQDGTRSFRNKQMLEIDTKSNEFRAYLKTFAFNLGRYDTVKITHVNNWQFQIWGKLAMLGVLLLAFAVGAYFISAMHERKVLHRVSMIALFTVYSLLTMILVMNFTNTDYQINSERLTSSYNNNLSFVKTTLIKNYGVNLTPLDYKNLVNEFNKDEYDTEVDSYIFQPPSRVVEDADGAKKNRGGAISFSFVGWLLGAIFGTLLLIGFSRKRGFEKFLNTLYNFATAYLFILPGILGMLVLVFIPIMFSVVLGFTAFPKVIQDLKIGRYFVGVENFTRILGDFRVVDSNHDYQKLNKVDKIYQQDPAGFNMNHENQYYITSKSRFQQLGTSSAVTQLLVNDLMYTPEDFIIMDQVISRDISATVLYPKSTQAGGRMLISGTFWVNMPDIQNPAKSHLTKGKALKLEGNVSRIYQQGKSRHYIVRYEPYRTFFITQNFYYTLGFTLLYTLLAVVIQTVLGVVIAVVLNEKGVGLKGFYQVVFMLPWIIPTFISGLLWNSFFSNNGVLDQLITVITGVTKSNGWFGDPTMGFFIVSFVSAWYAFPFIMLVTISALGTIPKSVFEAALIDGANWFQTLFAIVIPMIRPTVLPSVLLTSIWTFNNFNLVYLLTGGNDQYDILITRIYDFVRVSPAIAEQRNWSYGYASAYSALIFVVLLVYIYIFARSTNLTEKSY